MIFLIPIVYACFGTSSSEAKNRLFASIVLSVKSTQCVSFSKAAPGSLNPIFHPVQSAVYMFQPVMNLWQVQEHNPVS